MSGLTKLNPQQAGIGRTRQNFFCITQVIILASVLFFGAVIFTYADISNTVDNANILLYAVRHGRILNFYELSVERSVTNFAANYSFLIYIFFAVWQAPALLAAHHLGKDYLTCPWTMLWSKLLIIFFSAATAYLIYRIVYLCTQDRQRSALSVFLYYSSMMVFLPVFICAQIDAISMTFMLGGLYCFLQDKMKGFWLCFLIGAPCKMFALLMALPLVLVKEKNLIRASLMWFSMSGLIIFEKILFRGSPVYHYALQAQSRDAITEMLGANIELGRPITVFIVLYMALILYAYLREDRDLGTTLYMCLFLWGTFVSFSSINYYWIFLPAPFIAMCICTNDRFIRASVLVDLIGSFCYALYHASGKGLIFTYEKMVTLLFLPATGIIPPENQMKYANLSKFFLRTGLSRYRMLYSSVYVAAVLALLVLTCPRWKKGEKKGEAEKWILALRPIALGLFSALIVYAYTAKSNVPAYDTRESESASGTVNLISAEEENIVTQDLIFDDDRKLDELVLKFHNTDARRSNMALLYVEIREKDTGNEIFDTAIGCSAISDDNDLRIPLHHALVSKSREYQIVLHGKPGNAWYHDKSKLSPYFTSETEEQLPHARINSEDTGEYLYLRIR